MTRTIFRCFCGSTPPATCMRVPTSLLGLLPTAHHVAALAPPVRPWHFTSAGSTPHCQRGARWVGGGAHRAGRRKL